MKWPKDRESIYEDLRREMFGDKEITVELIIFGDSPEGMKNARIYVMAERFEETCRRVAKN